MLIASLIGIASTVGLILLLRKMDIPWWMAFIPVLPHWKMFEKLYGPGMGVECLKMFIPIYGIFIMYKFYFELTRQFGQDFDFGLWMIICPAVMFCVIGFSSNIYFIGAESSDEEVVAV